VPGHTETRFYFFARYKVAVNRLLQFDDVEPCHTFGNSHPINELYECCLGNFEGSPNPWHLGTINGQPKPEELIGSEAEILVMMFGLVLELKPFLVVETGCNTGTMSRALGLGCWVNGFGRVVTSDIDVRMVGHAVRLCEGLPVEVRLCPSLEIGELPHADLVFIDSSYASRTEERKLVKSGATYVYHDSHAEPWIRPEMETESFKIHLDGPRGFSIVRKP
jgi:hypothetical protein